MKRDWKTTRPGIEHMAKTSENSALATCSAAKSGAIQTGRIIDLDELPEATRRIIEAVLDAQK
jgi:hypothetical protein